MSPRQFVVLFQRGRRRGGSSKDFARFSEGGNVAKPILPDSVWWLVEPLLGNGPDRQLSAGRQDRQQPGKQQSGKQRSGRRPITDRRTLTGILFVLQTGVPWDQLPYELGCGSGMTCLRRLRSWQRSGTWQAIQQVLLEKLPTASSMDWSRVNVQRKRSTAETADLAESVKPTANPDASEMPV